MRRSVPAIAVLLAAALALRTAACTPELCVRNSDCPSGLVCLPSGACGVAPVVSADAADDAGVKDAATSDADALVEIP